MSDLTIIDAIKAIKQGSSSYGPVNVRVLSPSKKLPTFNGDPLSYAVKVTDPSMLEGQKGTLFAMTTDQTTFFNIASLFKSIASKDVGTLVDTYHTLRDLLGTYAENILIFFRPAGVVLNEIEWNYYNISTGECSDMLPAGDWTANFVMCCGCYGEEMIKGAPNSFVVYNKIPSKVTVSCITVPSGVAHDFSSDDDGVFCHESGNINNIFFHMTWDVLNRNKWDPTNRPIISIDGCASSVEGLSNPELVFRYDEEHVRFDCGDDLDFWLEIVFD
jgi:hypothetical protein